MLRNLLSVFLSAAVTLAVETARAMTPGGYSATYTIVLKVLEYKKAL